MKRNNISTINNSTSQSRRNQLNDNICEGLPWTEYSEFPAGWKERWYKWSHSEKQQKVDVVELIRLLDILIFQNWTCKGLVQSNKSKRRTEVSGCRNYTKTLKSVHPSQNTAVRDMNILDEVRTMLVFNQDNKEPLIPYPESSAIKRLWLTLSEALERSKYVHLRMDWQLDRDLGTVDSSWLLEIHVSLVDTLKVAPLPVPPSTTGSALPDHMLRQIEKRRRHRRTWQETRNSTAKRDFNRQRTNPWKSPGNGGIRARALRSAIDTLLTDLSCCSASLIAPPAISRSWKAT
ncbi:hypothetical protein J6590_050809 [Homalodisca vitripennis]|nr:hypothetical protein J6590_050809 [Homalodisca vitripennis]